MVSVLGTSGESLRPLTIPRTDSDMKEYGPSRHWQAIIDANHAIHILLLAVPRLFSSCSSTSSTSSSTYISTFLIKFRL